MRAVGLALVGVLVAAGSAGAEPAPEDPEAEPTRYHRTAGFTATVAGGPAVSFGLSAKGLRLGGGASIRVGTRATERLLWIFELNFASYTVQNPAPTDEDPEANELDLNTQTTTTIGAQIYILDEVWLRGGLGGAAFVRRQDDRMGPVEDELGGLALSAGGGVNLVRGRHFLLSIESSLAVGFYEQGQIASLGGMLALAWY